MKKVRRLRLVRDGVYRAEHGYRIVRGFTLGALELRSGVLVVGEPSFSGQLATVRLSPGAYEVRAGVSHGGVGADVTGLLVARSGAKIRSWRRLDSRALVDGATVAVADGEAVLGKRLGVEVEARLEQGFAEGHELFSADPATGVVAARAGRDGAFAVHVALGEAGPEGALVDFAQLPLAPLSPWPRCVGRPSPPSRLGPFLAWLLRESERVGEPLVFPGRIDPSSLTWLEREAGSPAPPELRAYYARCTPFPDGNDRLRWPGRIKPEPDGRGWFPVRIDGDHEGMVAAVKGGKIDEVQTRVEGSVYLRAFDLRTFFLDHLLTVYGLGGAGGRRGAPGGAGGRRGALGAQQAAPYDDDIDIVGVGVVAGIAGSPRRPVCPRPPPALWLLAVLRAFVIGGAGFIGSHLVDRLVERGPVTVFDDLSVGKRAFIERHLESGAARLVVGDARRLEPLLEAMPGHDVVFHLAANPEARRALEDTRIDLELGTIATYNALEAARRAGASRFVLASSGTVYGEAGERVCAEGDLGELPISLYGASKLAGEAMLSAFVECFGLRGFVYRFGNVVGPRGTHGAALDFLNKLKACSGRELEVLGDGSQAKPYLFVTDCVAGMLFGLDHAEGRLAIHNIAPPDTASVRFIAETCVALSPFPGASIRYTGGDRGWKGDVPRSRMSPERLAALGFRVSMTSEAAVRRSVEALAAEVFGS